MTDQNKQGSTNAGENENKPAEHNQDSNTTASKAATLSSILGDKLGNKFEIVAKFPTMQFPAWYGLVGLAVIIIVICWKQIAVGQVETDMAKQLVSEREVITNEARAYADQQYAQEEERFGQVLSWSVRSELIRGNLDQVSQYLNEVVKMKDTEMVVLISNEGELLVSTDKRFEDSDISEIYSDEVLKQERITLISNVNNKKLLIVPVMGLNNQLATIVVSYNPPAL